MLGFPFVVPLRQAAWPSPRAFGHAEGGRAPENTVVCRESRETVELMRQLEYRRGKPLHIHDLLAELHRYIEVQPKLQDE